MHQDPRSASVAARTAPGTVSDDREPSNTDRAFRARLARFTLGISPATVADAQAHWLSHLAMSPGKQMELLQLAARGASQLAIYATQSALDRSTLPPITPPPGLVLTLSPTGAQVFRAL